MFVEGKSRTVFFTSDTLIYGISRDGSKNYNIRTCKHMILGQLRLGARQTNNAPLLGTISAGGTEAVMHSIQPHGIDPIIPSYHLLPKGEVSPIHTP